MSEVENRPAGTLTKERRYGIAISVGLILGGAWWAVTDLSEDTTTSEQTYSLSGTALTIEAQSADLEIRSGDGDQVTVTQRFRRNLFGSDPSDEYRDGRLELGGGGCGFLSFGCETSYVVVVPKGVKVTARSNSGELNASDLPAGADLKASSGDIEVHRIGTDLRLASSSGDVEAFDVTGATVRATSSSGDVELTFSTAPTTVEATSSSGDVTIELPPGEQSYRVDADSSSGDLSTTVEADPQAANSVKARSSSGDVSIEYRPN